MQKQNKKLLQAYVSTEVVEAVECAAIRNHRTKSAQVERLLVKALEKEAYADTENDKACRTDHNG